MKILLLLSFIIIFSESYNLPNLSRHQISTDRKVSKHYFKKADSNNNSPNDGEKESFFQKIKRFLPWNQRVKVQKTYDEVAPSTGMRYHLRLLNPKDMRLKRHITTRVLRYFPDITWETAESLVVTANNEGAALLRVLNSQVLL
jgi:ATP-dependent Clp protease adapter protein ClpS